MMRREFLEASSAVVAGKVLRESPRSLTRGRRLIRRHDVDDAVADRQSMLNAVCDPRPILLADDQSIDHDFRRVFTPRIDLDSLFERPQLSVDSHADITI